MSVPEEAYYLDRASLEVNMARYIAIYPSILRSIYLAASASLHPSVSQATYALVGSVDVKVGMHDIG